MHPWTSIRIRAFSHLLGQWTKFLRLSPHCSSSKRTVSEMPRWYAIPDAPENTDLKRSLEHWFDSQGVHPMVAGEFEDSAMTVVFGGADEDHLPRRLQPRTRSNANTGYPFSEAKDIVESFTLSRLIGASKPSRRCHFRVRSQRRIPELNSPRKKENLKWSPEGTAELSPGR